MLGLPSALLAEAVTQVLVSITDQYVVLVGKLPVVVCFAT
jgi:hypothetical protein